MANGNDIRFNMWMTTEMHRDLSNEAIRDGRSAADVIRQLISEWLMYKKHGKIYISKTINQEEM